MWGRGLRPVRRGTAPPPHSSALASRHFFGEDAEQIPCPSPRAHQELSNDGKLSASAAKLRLLKKLRCTLNFEKRAWAAGAEHVAGVDEVGRGSLFGPVVAAAVISSTLPTAFAACAIRNCFPPNAAKNSRS